MTGFTIYETLRIFTPGVLAVFFLDVGVRLSTGRRILEPGPGGPRDAVDSIESVAIFAVTALALGLLLYLLDLPERLRIFRGDPNWAQLPSERMGEFVGYAQTLGAKWSKADAVSLYFLFADGHLPSGLQKRIYLFGALFKVYTDFRVLAVGTLYISAPAAITAARQRSNGTISFEFNAGATASILGLAAFMLVMGWFGHRTRQVRHDTNPSEIAISPNPKRPARVGAYTVVGQFMLTAGSIAIATLAPEGVAWVGIGVALCGLTAWFWIEIGPPINGSTRWRDRVLAALGAQGAQPHDDQPQFTPMQRTMVDLSVAIPALVGASIANAYWGRPGYAVSAWSIAVLPATLIMTIRKHESRLLGAYRHQETWLELNRDEIVAVLIGNKTLNQME